MDCLLAVDKADEHYACFGGSWCDACLIWVKLVSSLSSWMEPALGKVGERCQHILCKAKTAFLPVTTLPGVDKAEGLDGNSPCRMSIIRNSNVALSILRKPRVALAILRKPFVVLLIIRKSPVRC